MHFREAQYVHLFEAWNVRDIVVEYAKHVMRLGLTLFELLSEAMGLDPNHLKNMDRGYFQIQIHQLISIASFVMYC